uniref:Helicase POLQ-like n=1 Tax=Plectus sambesii TaxID=2011161 RepID=A0A914X3W3_9BILA
MARRRSCSKSSSPASVNGSKTPKRRSSPRKELFEQLTNTRRSTRSGFIPASALLLEAAVEATPFSPSASSASSEFSFYGLPDCVKSLFERHRKISRLYAWQESCLNHKILKNGGNLILSLPTGGGKTLIAEILMLKQALLNCKDSLLILPFVAIVQEKIRSLAVFGEELDICVEEYAATKGRLPPIGRRKQRSIFVATIEKAHSIVNSLIEKGRLDRLGLVVVDELHMLGDGPRGAVMEQCLAMVLHAAPSCQIVGMSATLSNTSELCRFLRADSFYSDFRPVRLIERIKLGDWIYRLEPNAQPVVEYQMEPSKNKKEDGDNVVELVNEVIPFHSCLVFCSTKKNCENLCGAIARLLPRERKELKQHKMAERRALLETMRQELDNRMCPTLERTIPWGIAYHHSGLTTEERRLIQDAYLDGVLCVICCTSTLAAGVNLPAKRVIIRSPMIGNGPLGLAQYKQMVGRAGRAGLDSTGESITIVQLGAQKQQFSQMLSSPLASCKSQLNVDDSAGLQTLLLSLISLKIINSRVAAVSFLRGTLFGIQTNVDLERLTDEAISSLLSNNLIAEINDEISPTALGRGSHAGPVNAQRAPALFDDLKLALNNGLVLSSYLHLLFCVVPMEYLSTMRINWDLFYREYCKLNAQERQVFTMLKVSEGYLVQRISHHGGSIEKEQLMKLTRLYLALMLNRLWKQQPVWDVATRFDTTRGWLQSFLQSTSSNASSIARFCEHVPELWPFKLLLPDFVRQLAHCVQMELIPLMELQGVKTGRARQLYHAGFKTVSAVAEADASQLTNLVAHLSRRQAQEMIASAKNLLRDEIAGRMEEMNELCGDKLMQSMMANAFA